MGGKLLNSLPILTLDLGHVKVIVCYSVHLSQNWVHNSKRLIVEQNVRKEA